MRWRSLDSFVLCFTVDIRRLSIGGYRCVNVCVCVCVCVRSERKATRLPKKAIRIWIFPNVSNDCERKGNVMYKEDLAVSLIGRGIYRI